jgi:ferricrocin synthase
VSARRLTGLCLTHTRFRVVIVVGRIPHTPSNKVDRKALAEIYAAVDLNAWEAAVAGAERERDGGDSDSAGERRAVEETLVDAVVQLTGVAPSAVRPDTDLRALGIDSVCGYLAGLDGDR